MEQFKRQLHRWQKQLIHFWQRVCAGSKLDIAILVCAVLLALVVLAILIFSVLGMGNTTGNTLQGLIDSAPSAVSVADSNYDKTQGELSQSQYADTILPQTEDAGQDYVDQTLFVGDSNTARMVAFGQTTWQNNLGVVSMGIQHVLSSDCVNLQGYGYVDVPTAISLLQPQRIIIGFGTNNAYSDTQTFIDWYRQALEEIQDAWPYADIIISAVPPVAQTRSYPDITMTTIDAFNQALVELAQEMGLKFLNTSEVLKDEDGYAVDEYMERDGIHLSEEGMDVLMEYIRTHALLTEDRRPKPLDAIPTHYETPEDFFNPPAPTPSSSATAPSSSEQTECAHQWVEYARLDPTCTDQGAIAYRCSLCGAEQSEILAPLGHTWGPTDSSTGIRTCTVCGYSETDPSWTPSASQPTPPASSTVTPPASSTPTVTPTPPASTPAPDTGAVVIPSESVAIPSVEATPAPEANTAPQAAPSVPTSTAPTPPTSAQAPASVASPAPVSTPAPASAASPAPASTAVPACAAAPGSVASA